MILYTAQTFDAFDGPFRPFIISTHSPFNMPNVLEGFGIDIEPGTSTKVTVTPTVYEANENLKSIPIGKRNCQFEFESTLKLFKNYSMNGCIFECLIEEASHNTNCTPWDYPHMEMNQEICNATKRRVFLEAIRKGENQLRCDQQCLREYVIALNTFQVLHRHL